MLQSSSAFWRGEYRLSVLPLHRLPERCLHHHRQSLHLHYLLGVLGGIIANILR